MLELRGCIQNFIDYYGVGGLKNEKLVRSYIRLNPCCREKGRVLLLYALKRIPELAEAGTAKADIPAIITAELA